MPNLDDLKKDVREGKVTAEAALEAERAGDNRATYIEYLEAEVARQAAGGDASDPPADPGTGGDGSVATSTGGVANAGGAPRGDDLPEHITRLERVTVHTTSKLTPGGAFYDPEQRATIGREPVTVYRTSRVRAWLLSEQIAERR